MVSHRGCQCQRTQFLVGVRAKAQVVKRGLRALALRRGGAHQIPSPRCGDLGKRRRGLAENGNVVSHREGVSEARGLFVR